MTLQQPHFVLLPAAVLALGGSLVVKSASGERVIEAIGARSLAA